MPRKTKPRRIRKGRRPIQGGTLVSPASVVTAGQTLLALTGRMFSDYRQQRQPGPIARRMRSIKAQAPVRQAAPSRCYSPGGSSSALRSMGYFRIIGLGQ